MASLSAIIESDGNPREGSGVFMFNIWHYERRRQKREREGEGSRRGIYKNDLDTT